MSIGLGWFSSANVFYLPHLWSDHLSHWFPREKKERKHEKQPLTIIIHVLNHTMRPFTFILHLPSFWLLCNVKNYFLEIRSEQKKMPPHFSETNLNVFKFTRSKRDTPAIKELLLKWGHFERANTISKILPVL